MTSASPRTIAAHYLPSRYHYWYARSKLASDPLYAAVLPLLLRSQAALLDVGCGIGLLPQYLRASGAVIEYRGVDIDARKIDVARAAARAGGLQHAVFDVCDLTRQYPRHRGSVALLDVLQYFDVVARDAVLDAAAHSISEDGVLIVRAGLDDGSWRATATRVTDRAQHAIRWMKTPPRSQPNKAELAALLARHGFRSEFRPAWGATPFNNWLVIAARGPS